MEGLRILLADENKADRHMVQEVLARSELEVEVEVEEVESLSRARSLLREKPFSCLILDYYLRDGMAMQLLQEAQAGELDLPPVIILTNSCNAQIAVELVKAGAADYLPKDELTPSRIAQSVRNALRVRDSHRALALAYEDLEQRAIARTAELAMADLTPEQEIAGSRKAEDLALQQLGQLAHTARLSTLGEMAASLAHELNQPLGAVANYANGCLRRIDSGTADWQTLRQALTQIVAQAERAGKIIHRLRSFASRKEPEMTVTDLNVLLREVASLVQPEARHREVEIRLDLDDKLPLVQADPIQVQQVALNLIRNGIESVQALDSSQRKVLLRTRPRADRQVEAVISDSGPPCDPSVLEQMFEPFFTTKPKGMGMGLTLSRSIVEAHRGELWAVPNPDGGLAFHFTLRTEAEA
jgi:C4-dicarboxylate-specific signal transduction histidine kinase